MSACKVLEVTDVVGGKDTVCLGKEKYYDLASGCDNINWMLFGMI